MTGGGDCGFQGAEFRASGFKVRACILCLSGFRVQSYRRLHIGEGVSTTCSSFGVWPLPKTRRRLMETR